VGNGKSRKNFAKPEISYQHYGIGLRLYYGNSSLGPASQAASDPEPVWQLSRRPTSWLPGGKKPDSFRGLCVKTAGLF